MIIVHAADTPLLVYSQDRQYTVFVHQGESSIYLLPSYLSIITMVSPIVLMAWYVWRADGGNYQWVQ